MKFFLALTILAVVLHDGASSLDGHDPRNFLTLYTSADAQRFKDVYLTRPYKELFVIFRNNHGYAVDGQAKRDLQALGPQCTRTYFCYSTDERNSSPNVPGNENDYWVFWKNGKIVRTENYAMTLKQVKYVVEEINGVDHAVSLNGLC